MTRVLKTFLLWLLMAALPIQGMAAAVKASCGPQHHDMSSIATSGVEHHHDVASLTHHHESPDADTALPDADVDVAETETERASDTKHVHKTSYCSACAACCFGAAAPPTTVPLMPAFSSVEAAVNPPVISYTGFIPAGLERPPRQLFA
jgi:hypothetical protein